MIPTTNNIDVAATIPIPLHYRRYIDTSYRQSESIAYTADFYEPAATHDMYLNFDELPPFATDYTEARKRFDRLTACGYSSFAGVIMIAPNMTVAAGIRLHEKGQHLINTGCLIGPYFSENQLVLRAFKFYQREATAE